MVRVSCVIVAGRDIGTGYVAEGIQYRPAFSAAAQVAAVEQDIRIGAKRIGPGCDRVGLEFNCVVIQPGGTELQALFITVTEDMDGVQVLAWATLADFPDCEVEVPVITAF